MSDPFATLDPDAPGDVTLLRRLADEQLRAALAGAVALGAQVQSLSHDSQELRRETRDGFARMEGHAGRTEDLLGQLVAEAKIGNKLREKELVSTRREAQTVDYSVHDGLVHDIIASLHGAFCAPGPER